MPKCSSCVPASVHDAPGIGFDLTASYGTSAVHRYDGSTADLTMVDGSDEYLAMMQRLSKFTAKPRESLYQRYLRRLNKALGRPATQDVGILSSVLSKLKAETENQLSTSIDRVVVSTPRFEALTEEDLHDALEYVGLRSWLIYSVPYPDRMSEAHAAFAGNGNGLCKQYTNLYECQEEYEDMPHHRVYAVTFTPKTLYTALVPITNAFTDTEDQHLIDFTVGLDSLGSFPSPSTYWAHILTQLRAIPESATSLGRRPISKILLLGESASNPDFLTALKDALAVLPTEMSPSISAAETDVNLEVVADPLFAAARGAAVYARRRQEVPWDCTEQQPKCDNERRRGGRVAGLDEL
ncbi:hypothetical protein MMC22_005062 [Lobaria immixta]|nr:hypothetical protein [Lobaria immixta]